MDYLLEHCFALVAEALVHLDELRTVRNVAQDLCNLRLLAGGSRAHAGCCWQALLRLCVPGHHARLIETTDGLVPVPVRPVPQQPQLAAVWLGINAGGKAWELRRRVAQHVDERIALRCRWNCISEVQPCTSEPWLQTIPGPQPQCLLHHRSLCESCAR